MTHKQGSNLRERTWLLYRAIQTQWTQRGWLKGVWKKSDFQKGDNKSSWAPEGSSLFLFFQAGVKQLQAEGRVICLHERVKGGHVGVAQNFSLVPSIQPKYIRGTVLHPRNLRRP